jgi:hypothetical protein
MNFETSSAGLVGIELAAHGLISVALPTELKASIINMLKFLIS